MVKDLKYILNYLSIPWEETTSNTNGYYLLPSDYSNTTGVLKYCYYSTIFNGPSFAYKNKPLLKLILANTIV